MKILVIDCEWAGLDFCLRCIADGHDVRWCCPSIRPLGRGFPGLTKVDDWRNSMSWVGKDGLIVLTGNSKWLVELDRYRDMGFKIFGPTLASAQLEINRKAGMDAMRSIGIDIPHFETFNSLQEAEQFAAKADQPYVFKPLGSEDDKSLTYVSSSPADMTGWLQRQRARGMKLKAPCMLQEKIDMVAEIGVSGWFGPEGFLPKKYQICFEHKKLMDGDIGPATGEMGTACQYVREDKVAEDMLLPMAPILQALGHRGDFAIGCGVDSKGKVWPFEFTARLGWPAFYIQVASHKGDVAQWMRDLLDGEDTLKVDYRPAIGVVLAQPPFPQWNGKEDCVVGNPICGADSDQVHPVMMMLGKGPCMDGGKVMEQMCPQTAGELVAVATGLGATVAKARKSCYGAVDEMGFSDMMYRTDIGEKLEEQLPMLHKFGLAMDMDFE